MSLADLVPLALECDFTRPRLSGRASRTAAHLRWVEKNRDRWNAYRREWWASRKAKA